MRTLVCRVTKLAYGIIILKLQAHIYVIYTWKRVKLLKFRLPCLLITSQIISRWRASASVDRVLQEAIMFLVKKQKKVVIRFVDLNTLTNCNVTYTESIFMWLVSFLAILVITWKPIPVNKNITKVLMFWDTYNMLTTTKALFCPNYLCCRISLAYSVTIR